jgi:hypothetical protein
VVGFPPASIFQVPEIAIRRRRAVVWMIGEIKHGGVSVLGPRGCQKLQRASGRCPWSKSNKIACGKKVPLASNVLRYQRLRFCHTRVVLRKVWDEESTGKVSSPVIVYGKSSDTLADLGFEGKMDLDK